MYKLIDFCDWIIDEETPFGSGASEKNWLINIETGERGIFKFPKLGIGEGFSITGEYWAEKLASEIAKVINLESAKVDLGIYLNRRGSMSYMLLNDNEELIEGIHYITKFYPNYDGDKFQDSVSGEIYSIQMIMIALENNEELKKQFIKIPIFDCLIGNSDRHHNNWAVIKNKKSGESRISPVYDNGSALCCYINPNRIKSFLKIDQDFESLIYGKSRSLIGWENQKKPRHFDLLKNIKKIYYNESYEFIELIKRNLSDEVIEMLVNNFEDDVIESSYKYLVIKFLIERKNRIFEIYNQGKEANYE